MYTHTICGVKGVGLRQSRGAGGFPASRKEHTLDCPPTEAVIATASEELLPLLRDTVDLIDALIKSIGRYNGNASTLGVVSSRERLMGDIRYNLAIITDLATDVVALGDDSQRGQARLALRAVNTHRSLLEATSGLVAMITPTRSAVKAS